MLRRPHKDNAVDYLLGKSYLTFRSLRGKINSD